MSSLFRPPDANVLLLAAALIESMSNPAGSNVTNAGVGVVVVVFVVAVVAVVVVVFVVAVVADVLVVNRTQLHPRCPQLFGFQ